MDKYIGFDIDDKKTVACVRSDDGKERFETFKTDVQQMKDFLVNEGAGGHRVHLTFEISGQAGYWYDQLGPFVQAITVSNPHQLTWIYRTGKKNDRLDARKQALLLSIAEIPKVHMPSVAVRQWRRSIQHRSKIVSDITKTKNRIKAVLKAHGFTKAACPGSWWKRANRCWMRQMVTGVEITAEQLWRMALAQMLDQLELLEQQLRRTTRYLDGYLREQPAARLLQSIPGVGPRTAEAVLAYTDDVRRFGRSKQYCAYFGLTPKLNESGAVRRLGHISKQGPSVVRWLIVEGAWRAMRASPALRGFHARVMAGQKGRKKIATVAVARKLLAIIRAMLLTGELFNEALVGRECREDGWTVNERAA